MKNIIRVAQVCLSFVLAFGVITLSGCSSADRSLVETFFPFRPNTIFVYEHSYGESFNQVMFIDHLNENVAQRTIITAGGTAYTEILTLTEDNRLVSEFVDQDAIRANFIGDSVTNHITLLSGPLSEGRTWFVHPIDGGVNPASTVISLNTRVTVPYGTFRALEVRTVGRHGDNHVETNFFAPGVGLIKTVIEITQQYGETRVYEMVLVDVIENTGLEENIEIFFPNDGELDSTFVTVSHNTNDNALYNYFNAANAIWRDAFGFELDFAWVNRFYQMGYAGPPVTLFPWFDFNEGLINALNQTASVELEEMILLSIAATFVSIYNISPVRTVGTPFNANEAYITINSQIFVSDRIEMGPDERIVVFETPEIDEDEYDPWAWW